MAYVIFYEKPGCANNARQKLLLSAAGHELDVRNLLTEPWTSERLLDFFGSAAVSDWFNRAAPKIKSGEIDPSNLDAATAISLMLQDPILIRRPLIEAEGRKASGFDLASIEEWLGLSDPKTRNTDLETCRRQASAQRGEQASDSKDEVVTP
jgi:nitrogenase-associated protein